MAGLKRTLVCMRDLLSIPACCSRPQRTLLHIEAGAAATAAAAAGLQQLAPQLSQLGLRCNAARARQHSSGLLLYLCCCPTALGWCAEGPQKRPITVSWRSPYLEHAQVASSGLKAVGVGDWSWFSSKWDSRGTEAVGQPLYANQTAVDLTHLVLLRPRHLLLNLLRGAADHSSE